MSKQKILLGVALVFGLVIMAITLFPVEMVKAEGPTHITTRSTYGWQDVDHSVGTTKLLRNRRGLTAVFDTTTLSPDQTGGVWFIFFNDPAQCSARPCTLPDDLLNPNVSSDLHFVKGQIINSEGKTAFAGHLRVGDTSVSGRAVLDLDEVALTAPYRAEVWVAFQNYEPELTEQDTQVQIKTYLENCRVYLGFGTLMANSTELRNERGCSTLQFSLHEGNGRVPFAIK